MFMKKEYVLRIGDVVMNLIEIGFVFESWSFGGEGLRSGSFWLGYRRCCNVMLWIRKDRNIGLLFVKWFGFEGGFESLFMTDRLFVEVFLM